MSLNARRLLPLAVLLAGLLAAGAAVALVSRWRNVERTQNDRTTSLLVSSALEARVDSLSRAVRGPALAFDLSSLDVREISGVLRLAYTQNDDLTAVTLVDEHGTAVVPAVFLSRGAVGAAGRAVESLDDLDRFARQIPFDAARTRGHAVRGPYPSARGDGVRLAVAEAVTLAEGTRTWVLAAEIDAAHLLDGLGGRAADADIVVLNEAAGIGALDRLPEEVRTDVLAVIRSHRLGREPIEMNRQDWRASVVAAPAGLEGALVVAWSGEEAAMRRARQADLALGVIILSIVGAFAAAVAVALREAPQQQPAAASMRAEARVLAAVVKELANPVAATAAAAQLLANEPGRSRVAEALQRSAQRVQRAFRRVARLARAGEEVARTSVDLAAIARRECDAMRGEAEQSGHKLAYEGPDAGMMVRADEDDLALLVQSLVDAARALAPGGTAVHVTVKGDGDEQILTVSDAGPMRAADRDDATALERASRTSTASPALALTLAARICEDHRARFALTDSTAPAGGVDAVVTFGGDKRHSLTPAA